MVFMKGNLLMVPAVTSLQACRIGASVHCILPHHRLPDIYTLTIHVWPILAILLHTSTGTSTYIVKKK